MARKFRRVVTGHDAEGKAVVVRDAEALNVLERPSRSGVRLTNFWRTHGSPPAYDGPDETVDGPPLVLKPPANGTVFRVVEFEPEDRQALAAVDGKAAFAEMGAAEAVVEGARHPFMHRTDTIDYAVILSGRITMLLDEDEVALEAGDVVVQRGTNHAWSNRGHEPCLIAFVLIDAIASGEG